jgi:hypothetical protein
MKKRGILVLSILVVSSALAYLWQWDREHGLSNEFASDAAAYFNLWRVDEQGADKFRASMESEGSRPAEADFVRAFNLASIKADRWEKENREIESLQGHQDSASRARIGELKTDEKQLVQSGDTQCFQALTRAAHTRWWGPPKECRF